MKELSDKEFRHLWDRRCDILYRAELSTLYHRRRESFFSLLDRWDKVFVLLLGSAAFVSLLTLDAHPWVAAVFVLLSLSNLVFDFSARARKHGELATKFKLVEAEIERRGERDWNEADLNEWSAKIREVESGEPAVYTLLVQICQNEMANARGDTKHISKVHWYEALLAHLFPFSSRKVQFRSG